jgi:hypothetical protein
MARAFFVLAPALAVCALGWLIHPVTGIAFGAVVAGLGIQVTRPRHERGEF